MTKTEFDLAEAEQLCEIFNCNFENKTQHYCISEIRTVLPQAIAGIRELEAENAKLKAVAEAALKVYWLVESDGPQEWTLYETLEAAGYFKDTPDAE